MSGRAQERTAIVDEIFEDDYIKHENITFAKLVLETTDNLSVIQWLARRRLILNQMDCPECGRPFTLKCSRRGVDVWEWRCRTDKVTRSVRWNSFFSKSPLSFQKILWIIYLWAYHFPQSSVAREVAVSKETVGEWFHTLQKVCDEILKVEPVREDGVSIKIEVDEDPGQAHMAGDLNMDENPVVGDENRAYLAEFTWRQKAGANKFGEIMSFIVSMN